MMQRLGTLLSLVCTESITIMMAGGTMTAKLPAESEAALALCRVCSSTQQHLPRLPCIAAQNYNPTCAWLASPPRPVAATDVKPVGNALWFSWLDQRQRCNLLHQIDHVVLAQHTA